MADSWHGPSESRDLLEMYQRTQCLLSQDSDGAGHFAPHCPSLCGVIVVRLLGYQDSLMDQYGRYGLSKSATALRVNHHRLFSAPWKGLSFQRVGSPPGTRPSRKKVLGLCREISEMTGRRWTRRIE
jgi:hypothetical protein